MGMADISVNRYVFAAMLNAVIVLFGIIAYDRIGIERSPNVDMPIISVSTVLPGANPEIIDSSITNIIEEAVNAVPGLDQLRSNSAPSVSQVSAVFELDKDINIAFTEVQAKVAQVLGNLPRDAEPPVVAKMELGASAVMWIALTGDRTLQQLNQYARNVVRKRLESIEGVGSIQVGGDRERAIRVEVDLERLTAFGITVEDIIRAFEREHLQLPGGYLVDSGREDLLKLDLEYHDPLELERLVIGSRAGATIYLRDVAAVTDSLADYRALGRFNGQPGVGLGVVKISGENTVEIVRRVRERLDEEIIPNLPPGLELSINSDASIYVVALIESLTEHVLAAALFAAAVVLLFLRSIRATLIVATAIPVSLLGAVVMMYFVGYTLNTMTMLGLLLLVGVVVDDAIVVLENIQQKLERGETDKRKAAIEGTREVMLAVVASTLTLASIFTAVLLMDGISAKYFRSFAIVVAGGVLVSLFVAMTLTPMLSSKFLAVSKKRNRLSAWLESRFEAMEDAYGRAIGWSIGHRKKTLVVALAIVATTPLFLGGIGGTFFPEEDEGEYIVMFRTPLGSSIDYTNDRMLEIEKVLEARPDVENYFATIGADQLGQVNSGLIFVKMLPREERELAQYDILPLLTRDLAKIPGVAAFPSYLSFGGGGRGEELQFALKGPDLNGVARWAEVLKAELDKRPNLGNVDLVLEIQLPQVSLEINRELAAEMGLSAMSVAQAANVLAGGIDVAKFNDEPGDGQRYDVRLKAAGDVSVADLSKIYLRAAGGELVRLDTVARFEESVGPAVVSRHDRRYAANFYTDPNVSLSLAIEEAKAAAEGILPPGYELYMQGRAREFARLTSSMVFAFSISLIMVYMVLASQFNSFIQPLIIMIAQPLAIIGGVIALWMTASSMNVFSMTGLVLLMGLVAKNSILLVDLTNQFRDQGMSVDEALKAAGPRRLRPILMTSFTIVLAMMVPMAGVGTGVELSQPLAFAVVGGMISSTGLTLIVVPAAYSLVERRREEKLARAQLEQGTAARGSV